MIYVGYILLAMLVLRFLVTLINYLAMPFLPESIEKENGPFISVLIPARNEETTLPHLLEDLQKSGYSNFEVIVCNDHSTDRTKQIIDAYRSQFPRLTCFDSSELPKGWIGKNFACHQLAEKATGDYLLFLDADVRVSPNFLNKAIGFASKRRLALLSVFPEQVLGSEGEWMTVPLMNWILLTFLPLPLVRLKWFSSLSAANGQTMLFEGVNYRANWWHKQVKSKNVEDILIARMMKVKKMNIEVRLGRNDVSCRMYQNVDDAINGFSRNIHQYFGGNKFWLSFFVIVSWLRLPFFVIFLPPVFILLSIGLFLLMKIMVSALSHQVLYRNILYYFSQLISLTIISFRNIKNFGSGKMEWKGRVYQYKSLNG
jgi:glycosyltransferase involved in cell wall biosynthesis